MRSSLEKTQLEKLGTLLREVSSNNAFYRDRLTNVSSNSLEAFYESCPFTTKADLVADREIHSPFGSNLTYSLERYTRYCQTSGTKGNPMPWLDTQEDWERMLNCWHRVYSEAGILAGKDRIFFAFSFGPFLGFWTAYDAAAQLGCLAIPGGGMSTTARLQTIFRCEATILCCTPTYAIRLGESRAALPESQRPDSIRTLIVAGEPGGSIPAVRQHIEGLWPKASVFDHHGLTEVGPVSFEDPNAKGNLCVIEESYLAEVIDGESEKEVAEGESGELVLTTLDRIGSPLLRYRTGDVVKKAYADDGRLSLEGGILARIDDMVVVRGVNIYPSAVDGVLRNFPEIIEYQVRQITKDSMRELVIDVELDGKVEAQIERALQDAFTLRIPVNPVAEGSLPRYEFKAKRWISH